MPPAEKVPREVVADICRQYRQKNPRVGQELNDFVYDCAEYYSLPYDQVTKIIGNLQGEIDAAFKAQDKSTAQKTYEVMGLVYAVTAQKALELLQCKKKRIRTNSKGETVLDKDGNAIYDEWDDNAVQVKALREANLMIGGHAPKQIEVEGNHHLEIREANPVDVLSEVRRLGLAHGINFGILAPVKGDREHDTAGGSAVPTKPASAKTSNR